jgi:hypothetical protein
MSPVLAGISRGDMSKKLNTAAKSKAVKRAIEALERSGRVTPDEVVEAAKSKSSPLHSCFDWDDSVAGHKWRLEQARTLIRTVKVQITITQERMVTVPGYIRDPGQGERQGYISVPQIKNDPESAQKALDNELRQIEGLLTRAENIAEACGFKKHVHGIKDRVSALRKTIQGRTAA